MLKDDVAPSHGTRIRLLKAGRQEFIKQGYYDTSIDAITEKAGVSHGTFYLHFNSKNELLIEIFRSIWKELWPMTENEDAVNKWFGARTLEEFQAPLLLMMQVLLLEKQVLYFQQFRYQICIYHL